MPSLELGLLAFSTGVLLHTTLYRHGEWDLLVPKLTFLYVVLWMGIVGWIQLGTAQVSSLASSMQAAISLGMCHTLGIALSMVVYRLFFHRLRSFSGPFWARISNIYLTILTSKQLHLYAEVEALHQKYGDIVRVGPSQLSIIDPKAFDAIYSARSPCKKGPWYNILNPRIALNMERDRAEHNRRRKVWDRGFGTRALRDYEPRVARYTDQLLAQIEATANTPINVTDWFNFYSFDVMGDLSFGKSFNMLRDGVKHYFMKSLHADLTNVGYLSHLPWLFPLLKITPVLNSEHNKFWTFCETQVQERRQMKPDRPDVFSWVLEDFESNKKTKQAEFNLIGDAYLIVVAGSDTTAATLTNLFYELALHPSQANTLRSEIDSYFETTEHMDSLSLSKLVYLDAVINETLRLHPPVPSGLQRETPPEGLQIGSIFVPGNTIVQMPLHTLFRDNRLFKNPSDFLPERWTTRPELNNDPSAFLPFSTGPYSCIGKQLALMELRYVVAQIIHRFEVKLAPAQDPESFLAGRRDTFTLALGPLHLIFSPRKS